MSYEGIVSRHRGPKATVTPRVTPTNSTCLARDASGVWNGEALPIAHVATPEYPDDAATKAYVDYMTSGWTVSGTWRSEAVTQIANPGVGRLRFNAATPALTTAIALASVDAQGVDASAILAKMLAGDFVKMQVGSDTTIAAEFECTAPPIAAGPWWELPVLHKATRGAGFVNIDLLVAMGFSPAVTRALLLEARGAR